MSNIEKYGVGRGDGLEDEVAALPTPIRQPGFFEISAERIKTARSVARNVHESLEYCKSMIVDPELAATMWYSRKLGKEIVEGPSTRLAEIAIAGWGNIMVAGNILEASPTNVTAEGLAVDVERNTYVRMTETRPILFQNRKRYPEHLIATTGKAAQSIAMRNAVFKVIPTAFIRQLMEHAKEVAAAGDIMSRFNKAVAYFKQQGVTEAELDTYLGIKSLTDVVPSHLQILAGLYTALKDGETTIDEAFGRARKRDEADAISTPAARVKPPHTKEEPPIERQPSGDLNLEGSTQSSQPDLKTHCQGVLGKTEGAKLYRLLERAMSEEAAQHLVAATPTTILAAALGSANPIAELQQIQAMLEAKK